MSNKINRFEVIDKNDIIVAIADSKQDAIYATSIYPGSYIYDTLTKKVINEACRKN